MLDTLRTHTPENIEQSSIDTVLNAAAATISELEFDPAFQAYLSETNQSLEYDNAVSYWNVIANYTESYLAAHEGLSPLEKESFTVIAQLPAAMTASYLLKTHKEQLPRTEFKAAKETVCSYNNLLKHFVMTYPQQSDSLHKNLLDATLQTIGAESKEFLTHTDSALSMSLKGVKHEIGFSRLLESVGIVHREATIEEDLKGRDIVVSFEGRHIGVDVKASLSDVEARGSENSPYAIKNNGDVVMWSLLQDADFNGGFEPNPAHIKGMAKGVEQSIKVVLRQAIAKQSF